MANVQKIIKTAAYDSIKKMRSFRFISAVMMVVGLVLAVTSGMDQLIGNKYKYAYSKRNNCKHKHG